MNDGVGESPVKAKGFKFKSPGGKKLYKKPGVDACASVTPACAGSRSLGSADCQ